MFLRLLLCRAILAMKEIPLFSYLKVCMECIKPIIILLVGRCMQVPPSDRVVSGRMVACNKTRHTSRTSTLELGRQRDRALHDIKADGAVQFRHLHVAF